MKKRFLTIFLAIFITFGYCTGNVMAGQRAIESKIQEEYYNMIESEELKQLECLNEVLQDENEFEEIDAAYKQLEIELPIGVEKEEELKTVSNNSRMLLFASGVCVSGNKTLTYARYTMNIARKTYYSISTSLKTSSYCFGQKLVETFDLPGMCRTNVNGNDCCDMTPQGIEYACGYIFITAYCYLGDHESVVYVIDGSTKEYITTLVLDGKPHVGGIAYANECLWICDGGNKNGKAIIHYYEIRQIINAIEYADRFDYVTSINLEGYEHGKVYLKDQSGCSFISAYQGALYIGVYNEKEEGVLGAYYIEASNGAEFSAFNTTKIPAKAQGIEFYNAYGYMYTIITTSSGVNNDSKVYVYRAKGTSSATAKAVYYKTISMPSNIEGPLIYNGRTYFVFESGSHFWGSVKSLAAGVGQAKSDHVGQVVGFANTFIYK